MAQPSLIGVVGGYGAVGRFAAAQLSAWGAGRLRVGGRDGARAAELAAELRAAGSAAVGSGAVGSGAVGSGAVGSGAVGWRGGEVAGGVAGEVAGGRVDVSDPASLGEFCAGCAVVLNCSGPARDIAGTVARAAADAGADYVDAAGDDRLHTTLCGIDAGPGWTAVVSAGMMPGLTGLLPRYLAAEPRRTAGTAEPRRTAGSGGGTLTAYVGGRDRFTLTAAVDYLATAGEFGQPMAAWRGGARAPRALATQTGVRLPFFPEPVTAQPYLSTETERLARALDLDAVDWFSVFDGEHVVAALTSGGTDPGDRDAAARRLCQAAELELFGRTPYQLMVFDLYLPRPPSTRNPQPLDGPRDSRTLVCRGTGASALTGTVAALAALAVARGEVPPGVHHAAEALHPEQAVRRLRGCPAVTTLELLHDPVPAVELVEEGAL